jgi:hypothetical protein
MEIWMVFTVSRILLFTFWTCFINVLKQFYLSVYCSSGIPKGCRNWPLIPTFPKNLQNFQNSPGLKLPVASYCEIDHYISPLFSYLHRKVKFKTHPEILLLIYARSKNNTFSPSQTGALVPCRCCKRLKNSVETMELINFPQSTFPIILYSLSYCSIPPPPPL